MTIGRVEAGRFRVAGVVGLATLVAVASVGGVASCKKWEDKMETGRQALLDSATPCRAPATCTAKMTISQREVSTCSAPPPDGKMYEIGDTVAVKDIGGIVILARVKAHYGKSYRVEFAEGVTNTREASSLLAQVCK